MQLQVECNGLIDKMRSCWTCDRAFQPQEAQVMICNDQGTVQGELCSQCVSKGFHWLSHRFEQISQPMTLSPVKSRKTVSTINQQLDTRIGA